MKKGLFGYSVTEVDIAINALREENESLNTTITSLKTHIKNMESGYSAKSNLLEADVKEIEESLRQTSEEKAALEAQLLSLSKDSEAMQQQNLTLNTQLLELDKQIAELTSHIDSKSAVTLENIQNQLDTELEYKTVMEIALAEKNAELSSTLDELAEVKNNLEQTKSHVDSLLKDLDQKVEAFNILASNNDKMKNELVDAKEALASTTSELENTKVYSNQKDQALEKTIEELEMLKAQLESANVSHSEIANKLIATEQLAANYNNMEEILITTRSSLSQKTEELVNNQMEIQQLKEELAAAKAMIDEQAMLRAIESKQQTDSDYVSEISLQAYHDMRQMRSEVIEYLHTQTKDYYQLVNNNNMKMRTVIEQCQMDYNHMLREFFSKLSAFRLSISNIDSEFNNADDYNINIDKISFRMNEIMENFINETNFIMKKNEQLPEKASDTEINNASDDIEKKSLNIQEFRTKRSDKQGYV
jgi:Chromosome segregation ATPases